ncbi:glycosyltransferase family 2 protein [Dongia rigui]|uniref:Glycosyltransferase family 2 protein n=1 Tax=Dongia rigui TaxID=940149 RepID=A0ABU5DZE7_9PROT|nr:glycosyltransferase family 2 protein [Dongia rigui]MDY0872300.1 glycosyltransferase family 2 protein [Dongia rigui]
MSDLRKIVSIVVPFFNEGSNVELFAQGLVPILAELTDISFEIVCVDDGSTDDTLARLVALNKKDPRFRIIELSRNFGKEAALTAGIDHARGDAVIPIDADLQDPPELIAPMIAAWRAGAEVVLARRVDRSVDPPMKQHSAAWFYRIYNRLSHLKLPENVGDFRLMDRVVVEALKSLTEQQRFMKGLFAWVGFRTVTLDYQRRQRASGTTKFSGWKLWNLAVEGVTSFSTVPLKVWTYIGLAGALATAAYAIFIVARTLIIGVDVPGYASLLVAILFIGSLQLVSIGVLGEYIGRIYMESKRRPTYIVRRRHGGNDEG